MGQGVIYNKDKSDFTFDYIKSYDILKIKDLVLKFDNEWFIDTTRQDNHFVHKDTNTYMINKVSQEEKPLTCVLESKNQDLLNLVMPIVKELEEKLDGKMGMVMLIKSPGGKDVLKHVDSGEYILRIARHHIPIITNENVVFVVDGIEKHLPAGECWEINNNKNHGVYNKGKEDRVHLLIDIMPNKFLNDDGTLNGLGFNNVL
jgi:Aspartyl/Asparaginyl beta-hydroxylase